MLEKFTSSIMGSVSKVGAWKTGKEAAWAAGRRIVVPAGATAIAVTATDGVSVSRVVFAIVITLLIPVVAFLPMRRIVSRQSNTLNAMLLGFYCIVDAFVALVAVQWHITGWIKGTVFAMMLIGGFFYNVAMMSFAYRLERD